MNTIDTEIRHVTKPGTNLFSELGFTADEANLHHVELQKQIDHTRMLKEQLMEELAKWIKEKKLKQEEAAELLHITRPRVSDVVNKKTNKFTIDALVTMLVCINKPIKWVFG